MKKKYRKSECVKNKIMASGAEIFIKTGFYNARIIDIVKEANVTRGAFYYYFKNKLDLLQQIFNYFAQTIDEMVELESIINGSEFIVPLKKAIIRILDRLENDKEYKTYNKLIVKMKYVEEFKTNINIYDFQFKEVYKTLLQIIKLADYNNELKPNTNLEQFTFILLSSLIGIIENLLINPEIFSVKNNSKLIAQELFVNVININKY